MFWICITLAIVWVAFVAYCCCVLAGEADENIDRIEGELRK
jgi:hypothetical protein